MGRFILTIDYALYEQYLDGADLSEAQKQEFLDTLWSIIVGFVDLGFGVHPVQQAAQNICDDGLCGHLAEIAMPDSADMLDLSNPLPKQEFAGAADGQIDRSAHKERP